MTEGRRVRRSAMAALAAAVVLGALLAGAVVLAWRIFNGPAAGARDALLPPSGPVAAKAVLAATRVQVLAAAGADWTPVQERDQPCLDSTPALAELDLRSTAATTDDLRHALAVNGWQRAGRDLQKKINRADVQLAITGKGHAATVSVTADNGVDGYCQEPEAPPTTFVPSAVT